MQAKASVPVVPAQCDPDSLYKAIAQGLNELPEFKNAEKKHTVESLRNDVLEFLKNNPDFLASRTLPGKKPDSTGMDWEYYANNLPLKKISPKNKKRTVVNPQRLAGIDSFEGKILCRIYHIGLHIRYVHPTAVWAMEIRTPFEEDSQNKKPVRADRTFHLTHDVLNKNYEFSHGPQHQPEFHSIQVEALSSEPLNYDRGPDLAAQRHHLENLAFGYGFNKTPGQRKIINHGAYLNLQIFIQAHGTAEEKTIAKAAYTRFLGVLDDIREGSVKYDITVEEDGFDDNQVPNYIPVYSQKPVSETNEAATDVPVDLPRWTQIFNPIEYGKKLDQERQRLAREYGPEYDKVQAINEKLDKFEAFMKNCAEEAESDERDQKNYSYNLYEDQNGDFFSETIKGSGGSFTGRQLFVSAVWLTLLTLLFWAMWYQGAATFYQTLIEEKLNLAESIYATISAVFGKMLLLKFLGEQAWINAGNVLFNLLSAPLTHLTAGLLWFLRGQWSFSDITNLLGFGITAGSVASFFALLTPNATEGLIKAIDQKNLTQDPTFSAIRAISVSPVTQAASMTGSALTNALSVAGAFGFTLYMQREFIRRTWVAFQPGTTRSQRLYALTVGFFALVPVGLFAWRGMGLNFERIGAINFDYAFKIGNAAPVLAAIPSGYIMMLYLTTNTGLSMWFSDTLSSLFTRTFDWKAFRKHNDEEYSVPVQILVNGVSFIVTLGFTTTGMVTTLWQQVISGQKVTAYDRVAGAVVATTIEFEPTYIISKNGVEGVTNYLVALFRNSFDDFAKREMLSNISDNPDDDKIACPVQHWKEAKERQKTQPRALGAATKSGKKSGRCCSIWGRKGYERLNSSSDSEATELEILLAETNTIGNVNNDNNNNDNNRNYSAAATQARSSACVIL